MGITYNPAKKRYIARIRRRGIVVERAFVTKSQAEAFHNATLQQIFEQGDLGKKQRRTLDEAIEKFLDEEVSTQRSSEKVESNIRALMPHTVGLYLDEIGEAVRRTKTSMRQSRRGIPVEETPAQAKARISRNAKMTPLKPATINRRLAVLRRVANLAYNEWHWLDRPIAARLLPEHNQRHEYLTADEVRRLADSCAEPVNHMVVIAAYTGMRRGEILKLTKENLRGDTIFLGLTKNGKPKSLPISPVVRAHLSKWIAAPKSDPRTMYKVYKEAAKTVGRQSVTFHDLRHTAASFLLNAGFDLATVAEVLGCTIQNAQRYAHLSLENKRNALFSISANGQNGEKLAVRAKTKKKKLP